MTRKRRGSEAVASCNLRDPLNLKSVGSDPIDSNEEPNVKYPNFSNPSLIQSNGESSQNSGSSNGNKRDESKIRNESLAFNKSLPTVITPPRVIRPLLARNPKDPLDLFGAGPLDELNQSVSRSQKVPSPVIADPSHNLHLSSTDAPSKVASSRKRQRARSSTLAEAESLDVRPQRLLTESQVSSKMVAGKLPSFGNKATKKPRRTIRRKRKRKHGKRSDVSLPAGNHASTVSSPALDLKKKVSRKLVPISSTATSSLSSAFSVVRSLFIRQKILHIGACGDNGAFSLQLATQFGAEHVLGVDRCEKRIRIARRKLGSYAGQISLANCGLKNDHPNSSDSSNIFPRSMMSCFGPIGPDIDNQNVASILQKIEYTHTADYVRLSNSVLPLSPSNKELWDTIVIQESVLSSTLSSHGPAAVHDFLKRIADGTRIDGHVILVMGRLRWQKQLHAFKSPVDVGTSSKSQADNPSSIQLHPLTQLRKFFRFRLVRRIAGTTSFSRNRKPSGVSGRGFSPFPGRSRGHALLSNLTRPQSLLSVTPSLPFASSLLENNRTSRRNGHRIIFVLQKKGMDQLHEVTEGQPSSSAQHETNL